MMDTQDELVDSAINLSTSNGAGTTGGGVGGAPVIKDGDILKIPVLTQINGDIEHDGPPSPQVI